MSGPRVGVVDVAAALEVSPMTIRRWAAAGRIPGAEQTIAGRWSFDPWAAVDWARAEQARRRAAGQTSERNDET